MKKWNIIGCSTRNNESTTYINETTELGQLHRYFKLLLELLNSLIFHLFEFNRTQIIQVILSWLNLFESSIFLRVKVVSINQLSYLVLMSSLTCILSIKFMEMRLYSLVKIIYKLVVLKINKCAYFWTSQLSSTRFHVLISIHNNFIIYLIK